MMLVRAYLAPSAIEGLGVYSRDDIKKGDLIWRFDARLDQLIPRDTLDQLDPTTREFVERYGYDMRNHPDHIALDADEGRFMNHCNKPNTDFSHPDYGFALEDIPAGTELTCDYREFTTGELVFLPSRHAVGAEVGMALN